MKTNKSKQIKSSVRQQNRPLPPEFPAPPPTVVGDFDSSSNFSLGNISDLERCVSKILNKF